jgi:hypothetical protein
VRDQSRDKVDGELTGNQNAQPKWGKVKRPTVDPSIVSPNAISLLAVSPTIQAVMGKWSNPTPEIRVVVQTHGGCRNGRSKRPRERDSMNNGLKVESQRAISKIMIDHQHVVTGQHGIVNWNRNGQHQHKSLRRTSLLISDSPYLIVHCMRWNGPRAHEVADRFGGIVHTHHEQQTVVWMR